MYLLYCDESGSATDAAQKYFVLAGVCLFERQGFFLSNEMDQIAARFNSVDAKNVELHGSPMFTGKKFWRQFLKEERVQAIKDALSVLANAHHNNRIFACIVDKEKASPRDAVELAFEQLASRFDHYLMRLHKRKDTQRGVIIFDKSTYETTIQNLATDFRTIGHTWGVLRNLSEVPLFLDSRASRLIQLADLIAYSLFKKYEHGDNQFAQIFEHKIDSDGGIMHGLYEYI